MFFSRLEIAGLACIALAAIIHIGAVSTVKWRTGKLGIYGLITNRTVEASYSLGLFKICSTVKNSYQICANTGSTKDKRKEDTLFIFFSFHFYMF